MQEYSFDLLKNVQNKSLEMAKYFVSFCNEHNLLCYFCGGGCIGAVRHEGFIPWDDDLDFFLPREDYEKIKILWSDTNQYSLTFPQKDYNDHCMFMTMRDKTTTMIKPYQVGLNIVHGISIDIFPLDGYPSNYFHRFKQLLWGLIFQLFCSQMVPQNHGLLITYCCSFLLKLIKSSNHRYKIWKLAEKNMSKYSISNCDYITEICAGPNYMRNKYPKEIFSKSKFVKFENTMMPIPIGYDTYLKIVFGDYMVFPPENKRIPSHDALIIDPNKPYTEYIRNGIII